MLYFILILTILVLVHELGHFLFSLLFKVKVEEFGIGFPPAFFKRKIKGTKFSLNILPLGGFVKIYGEDGSNQNDPDSFASKKLWQKIVILIAGVFNNLVLGYGILAVLLFVGLPLIGDFNEIYAYLDKGAIIKREEINITLVRPDSPAMLANIKVNDKILNYGLKEEDFNNQKPLQNFEHFVQNNKGREIYLQIKSKTTEKTVALTPRIDHPENDGPIGVGLMPAVVYSYPFGRNFVEAFNMVTKTFTMFFKTIGNVFGSIFNLKSDTHDVSGPVGIAVMTNSISKLGSVYLIAFLASFSINLAIVNLLPIPGLDGGRILLLLIEKIIGKKIGSKIENYSVGVGLAFLIVVVIFVTIKDVLFYFIY